MNLTQLAATQFGVISRTQALALVSPEAVRWKLERGLWWRVHPGVYAGHTQELEWHARASAALLCYGEGAALSLESAAFMLDLIHRHPGSDAPAPVARAWTSRPLRSVSGVRRFGCGADGGRSPSGSGLLLLPRYTRKIGIQPGLCACTIDRKTTTSKSRCTIST